MREIVYNYIAYNEAKEIVKGRLEARNEEHASELLSTAGYQLINLKEIANFPTLSKLLVRFFPIKPTEVILFYRQMALLIESGLNIVTALELLEGQATHALFRRVLSETIADLRGGGQLSVSLAKHPEIFQPIHCQSLKVGEQTGGMETILRQMADHLEKQVNTGKGIKNAMTYPIIALIVAIVVVAVMVVFVFPAFQGLYSNLGVKMPAAAQFMMTTAEKLREYGMYIMVVFAAAVLFALAYLKTASGKYKYDQLALKFPVVGRINHLNELARLARSVSVLFKAGLPLTEILPLVIQSSSNKAMAEALVQVKEDMLGGEGLSRPMAKYKIFLPMMVQMVRVGEETGSLDATLLSVAQSYETEAEDKTKAMIGMIQPVMTIVIGLVVGFMALSLVSAMYSMYQGVK